MGVLNRVWKAVKPPPAAYAGGGARKKLTRKQKRLLKNLALVAILAGAGWSIYAYMTGTEQRADKEYQTAMKLMGPGKYQEAIVHFTRALEVSPQLANAYLERGVSYAYLNENDQALADLAQAIALNPNLAHAHSARGSIFRVRGDFQQAMLEFSDSLTIEPNLDAFYERGETYEALNQHQNAIDDYDRAIAVMQDSPNVYRSRALAKRNLGDTAGYESDRDMARTLERRR
jgi:tetratricopeptide (TPR) repeat protein